MSEAKMRVRVLEVGAKSARCKLVRGDREKTITLKTLREAYRLVERGGPTASP